MRTRMKILLMLTLLLSVLCLGTAAAAGDVAVDAVNFPDANFRNYVLTNLDKNGDKTLSASEIAAVTSVNVSGCSIRDLTGIEHFTALENLDCSSNQLTSLNVSGNPALTMLNCTVNQLTSLNVRSNPALTQLYCGHNQLSTINLSSNPQLEWLECNNNRITVLNVSGNASLRMLECRSNRLARLDASNNPALQWLFCQENRLSTLNLSGNTALTDLYCSNNLLTTLDVSSNTSLKTLSCSNNRLTTLDVSSNPSLTTLSCTGNSQTVTIAWINRSFDLTTLPGFDVSRASAWVGGTVSGNTLTVNADAERVTYAYDCGSGFTAEFALQVFVEVPIDAEHFPDAAFREFIKGYDGNQNGFFSHTEFTGIGGILMYNKGVTSVKGLEYFTSLTLFDCTNNQIQELDVSPFPNLSQLTCQMNQLTQLTFGNNPALNTVGCFDNQLTTLDVSGLPALESLGCYNNQLTSLDVTANPKLSILYCSGNQLTSLDLSNNPNVTDFQCTDNAYTITVRPARTFDLATLPGNFNVNRTSNWVGGVVSGTILIVNEGAEKVTYTYDCGNGFTADFTLNVVHGQDYTLTASGTNSVNVDLYVTADDALVSEILAACGSKTISTFTIHEGAALGCSASTVILAEKLVNYGAMSGGDFRSAVTHNYGLIDGGYVSALVNYESGVVDGSACLYGSIENYGNINRFSYHPDTAVTVNEGYIRATVTYNGKWAHDDGWGWEDKTITANYGQRVGDALGEGWYTTSGEYAIDMTLGFSQTLRRQWTRQKDGGIVVKAANQADVVYISGEMAGNAPYITVQMGKLSTDQLTMPVELSWTVCDDSQCYYTSGISGGKYQDVTVTRTCEISGGQINGTLTLNSACRIDQSVMLASYAQCIANDLTQDVNRWNPSGYPYAYHLPMTLAEGCTVDMNSSFYGTVTNCGTISSGYYYGDVRNYGTVTGGTFKGAFWDFTAHAHAPGDSEESVSWTRWDGSSALTLNSGDNYIALAGDVTVKSVITVPSGAHLYLCLDGCDLIQNSDGEAAVIIVKEGSTLSLHDCKSAGSVTHADGKTGRGVNVVGTMYMYGGRISGNVSNSDGGGVCVYNGGAFVMNGGTISGNGDGGKNRIHGGGVYCEQGTFIMNGGSITGNAAVRGGGVRVGGVNNSVMELNGGTISGNTASDLGGGVYVTGDSSAVTISGGAIGGNSAGEGGAIFFNSSARNLTITGGAITGNTATTAAGGLNGPVILSGNPTITGNTLADGTVSNLLCEKEAYGVFLTGEFTGIVGVNAIGNLPAAGTSKVFATRTDGAVTQDDLARFVSDTAHLLYINEDGKGVIGHELYTLTLTNAAFTGGTSTANVKPGTPVAITAAQLDGKVFSNWTREDGREITETAATFTFTMPPQDVSITANYVDEFVIVDGALIAYNGETVELLIIPEGVTAIADGALTGRGLVRVFVPDAVTAIGESAFDEGATLISSSGAYARAWAAENGYAWEHDAHTEAILPAVPATCIAEGLTEGLWCPACGMIFVPQEKTPLGDHTCEEWTHFSDPTCEEPGYELGLCAVCGDDLIRETPALGHTEVVDPGKAASCTENGLTRAFTAPSARRC